MDIDAGMLLDPPNLPGWDNMPIRQLLADRGFLIPQIHIRDNLRLGSKQYTILIKGVEAGKGDNIAWLFFKDGIRSLLLKSGVEMEELVPLLEVIEPNARNQTCEPSRFSQRPSRRACCSRDSISAS